MRITGFLIAIAIAVAACTSAGVEPATTSGGVPSSTTETTATTLVTSSGSDPTAGEDGVGDPFYPSLGNSGYDVEHYTLDLVYPTGDGGLGGVATIQAIATSELASFNLDFATLEAGAVLVDGQEASTETHDEELTVTPQAPIETGMVFEVVVPFAGIPLPYDSAAVPIGIGWLAGTDGEQFVAAEPDAAHSWFPSNDHPSDKATFTISITVPDGTFAAANGTLTDTTTDIGTTTFRWEMDHPMATYLATVVIGEGYSLVPDQASSDASGIVVRNVLPADLVAAPPPGLERTGEMIEFFSGVFGPYPFDEYGIAVVSNHPSALENQTLSVFDRSFVESPIFEFVVVHELAHQWFGDSVTPATWNDIWLNEGFATYAELLWIEHEFGSNAYDDAVDQRTAAAEEAGLLPPGDPPPEALFNRGVYQRGGLTVAALREEIGDEAFFATLVTYTDRFAYGNASTADFIGVAEEVSGRDLSEFFTTWLYDPDIPD